MNFTTDYQVDFSKRDYREETDELFYSRWSPRSFKKVEIPENAVASMIDAARWSTSSFNEQPWLFCTSSNDSEFNTYLELLLDMNQVWAKNASLLGFIFAKRHFEKNGDPNRFYFFDCGSAWLAFTLQARKLGLYTHAMGGIKRDQVAKKLNVPEDIYEVICGFALGAINSPQTLPDDLKTREFPSPRKPLSQIWKKGSFQ